MVLSRACPCLLYTSERSVGTGIGLQFGIQVGILCRKGIQLLLHIRKLRIFLIQLFPHAPALFIQPGFYALQPSGKDEGQGYREACLLYTSSNAV